MRYDEARASTVDETLRAVVAAERLALSAAAEGREVVHRRLVLFYGCFALLGALATVAGRIRGLPISVEPSVHGFLLDLQSGHALVLAATFAALRWWVRDPRWVRGLDAIATLATAATGGIALSVSPRPLIVDLSAVSFFVLFFCLRAALVPSKPWLATLIAAASAIPFAVGLAILYRRAQVPDPGTATAAAVRVLLGGIAGVYVVSRTIYGLRRVAEESVQLGQYVIHEKIGEGGMGAVYRASHAMLKRPTAIKLIAPHRAGAAASARFEREVLAASRLSHPNNVAIYDFGRTRGGVFYYAMELLDGRDLGRLVDADGPLPVPRAIHVLRQLVAALGEAHAAGLVHRDVKPENVMLCTRGGMADVVKVLDFGLVKDIATVGAEKLTAAASIAGTPLFMAPEAFIAPATVGPPADIYAVGCVAWFLLTGRPPFARSSLVEVGAAHVHTAPEPPSSRAPGPVPAALDALVLACLAKDPRQRPTAPEVAAALAALGAGDDPGATPWPTPTR
jgi:hypothetical protein